MLQPETKRQRVSFTHAIRTNPDEINRVLSTLTQILETEALNNGLLPDWTTFRMSVEVTEDFPALTLYSSIEAE